MKRDEKISLSCLENIVFANKMEETLIPVLRLLDATCVRIRDGSSNSVIKGITLKSAIYKLNGHILYTNIITDTHVGKSGKSTIFIQRENQANGKYSCVGVMMDGKYRFFLTDELKDLLLERTLFGYSNKA